MFLKIQIIVSALIFFLFYGVAIYSGCSKELALAFAIVSVLLWRLYLWGVMTLHQRRLLFLRKELRDSEIRVRAFEARIKLRASLNTRGLMALVDRLVDFDSYGIGKPVIWITLEEGLRIQFPLGAAAFGYGDPHSRLRSPVVYIANKDEHVLLCNVLKKICRSKRLEIDRKLRYFIAMALE